MGDFIATLTLCAVVATVAYVAGGNDRAARVCDDRAADGRYILQRVELVGNEDDRVKLMVDKHNRILNALCKR